MKYYGQFNPPVDKILHDRYFNKTNGTAIEAGAADGITLSSTKFFEENLNWDCINIEPHPDSFKLLQHNRSASLNINCALSDTNGSAYLKHGPNHILRAGLVNKPKGKKFQHTLVKTITYNFLIKFFKIKHVDLLVLDVEGHELNALKGMKNAKVLPNVICIEYNHTGLQPIANILRPLGYHHDYTKRINAFFIR